MIVLRFVIAGSSQFKYVNQIFKPHECPVHRILLGPFQLVHHPCRFPCGCFYLTARAILVRLALEPTANVIVELGGKWSINLVQYDLICDA